jgi:hypothetical protein
MVHFLTIKSVKINDDILIKRKSAREAIDKFLDKFPDYWTPPKNYESALVDLVDYTNGIRDRMDTLDVVKANLLNVNYEFYVSSAVKKLLNFNMY